MLEDTEDWWGNWIT